MQVQVAPTARHRTVPRRPKTRGSALCWTVMVTVSVPACGLSDSIATKPPATTGTSVQPVRSVPCWKTWVVSLVLMRPRR